MKAEKPIKLNRSHRKAFYSIMFPALAETLISCLFQMIDSIMVGQMPNSTIPVAAIGMCVAPVNLIIAVTAAFFIGTTATVAWYYGAGDKKQVRNVAWQSIILSVIIAFAFSAVSLFGSRGIMRFICGDSEILETAASYYHINAYGFLFQIITLNITAAFRGIGITAFPLMYNLSGSALNVLLNYIMIYGKLGIEPMGVEGAAWATSISKMFSFVLAVIILIAKDSDIKFRKGTSLKFSSPVLKRLVPIGLTSAAEQVLLQSGAIISSKIISVLPTAHIASSQVVASLESFAWSSGNACCTASTSLFGRCLGERNEPKARAYLRLILKWAIGCAALEMAIFAIFGKQLAALFTNDISLYPMIAKLLIICAVSLPFINSHQTISGALRSAGDSFAPLMASLISLWVFRVGMGFLTIRMFNMGIEAYRCCFVADQTVRCIAVAIFYLSGHWKKKVKKLEESKPKETVEAG